MTLAKTNLPAENDKMLVIFELDLSLLYKSYEL